DRTARGEPGTITGPPAARDRAHIGHEADAADHRRRRNRPPAGLVVEGHVARDDRNPERLRRLRDALDRFRELPADLRLLGIAEVEAGGQRERLAPGAGDAARRVEDRFAPGRPRIPLAERRPVERDREPAPGRPQPQHRRAEPRPAHRARLDKVVVLLVDPGLRLVVDGVDLDGAARGRQSVDLVAGTLVGQPPGGELAGGLVVEEDAQLAAVGDLADRGVVELPAVEHSLYVSEPLRLNDGDHPLLALGDHDLPRLHSLLAQRHAVEVDVDPGAVARHLGERGGEAGGATVLKRLDQPSFDQLQRGLDQLLAGERVADLDGRTLLSGAFAELLAREHRGAADTVAAGGGAVEHDEVAGPASAGARDPLRGQQSDAHRVDEAVAGVGLV